VEKEFVNLRNRKGKMLYVLI